MKISICELESLFRKRGGETSVTEVTDEQAIVLAALDGRQFWGHKLNSNSKRKLKPEQLASCAKVKAIFSAMPELFTEEMSVEI